MGSEREFFKDDAERWREIDDLRENVAKRLRIRKGSTVLDVLVGEGDFARTVAKRSNESYVVAGEILASDMKEAKRRIRRDKLKERVELLRMDVTLMPFRKGCFDYAVNFSGWEDFTSVSGEELLEKAFGEMVRVLRTSGSIAVTFIPRLEPKDEVSRKDVELLEYMYKSSKRPVYFLEGFFIQMLEKHGIRLLKKRVFEARKNRFRPQHAKRFLKWVCRNYKSFYAPDVEMRSYEEILRRFGRFIEKYGLKERRYKFILLQGKKER